ncbi:threonine aldolase family protein [Salinicoccus roseus]|uniref:Threonine aldolase n=1 Tax=Salinicoccus roseus TaxID=45670 RepID=A0A0C2HDT9_9STAP|nr:low specificity L-threonine aldolase [Salinicoccus roseus]KIH71805.1 threonine aldolase [Salinicoccus roseus]MDB0578936.1 low specificity L-threonine aldolase [Salinicoccus roseus]
MIRFDNDYTEGAHPRIMEKLAETNEEQLPGYGRDHYSDEAKALITRLCDNDVDVHFMVGGTQANLTIISSALRTHQGVIAPDSGHIAADETGAIEATGHKVLVIENENGKISAAQIRDFVDGHWTSPIREHMAQPKMVCISQPTESGTMYSKQELEEVRQVCDDHNLHLMVDGARLGYALASEDNDVTLADLARLCDVFYIGGTKVGALFGEAVVISNSALKEDFRYIIKQKGGMLAKGRLLGIQFKVLFQDELYVNISRHALKMAKRLQEGFESKGINMHYPSPTNQLFPVLTTEQMDELSRKYAFQPWEELDEDRKVIRFCTSWSTKENDVEALIADIGKL